MVTYERGDVLTLVTHERDVLTMIIYESDDVLTLVTYERDVLTMVTYERYDVLKMVTYELNDDDAKQEEQQQQEEQKVKREKKTSQERPCLRLLTERISNSLTRLRTELREPVRTKLTKLRSLLKPVGGPPLLQLESGFGRASWDLARRDLNRDHDLERDLGR